MTPDGAYSNKRKAYTPVRAVVREGLVGTSPVLTLLGESAEQLTLLGAVHKTC